MGDFCYHRHEQPPRPLPGYHRLLPSVPQCCSPPGFRPPPSCSWRVAQACRLPWTQVRSARRAGSGGTAREPGLAGAGRVGSPLPRRRELGACLAPSPVLLCFGRARPRWLHCRRPWRGRPREGIRGRSRSFELEAFPELGHRFLGYLGPVINRCSCQDSAANLRARGLQASCCSLFLHSKPNVTGHSFILCTHLAVKNKPTSACL